MPVDLTRAVLNQLHLQKKKKCKLEDEHNQEHPGCIRFPTLIWGKVSIHLAACEYFGTYHLTSNLDLLISQLLTANKGPLNRQLKLSPLK